MDITDRLGRPEDGGRGHRAATPLVDAFESFVSAAVHAPAERIAQARLIAGMTIGGFLAAAAAPIAAFAGSSVAVSLLPLIFGSSLLGAAATLAATGRPRPVFAGLAGLCGLVAAVAGGAHTAPLLSVSVVMAGALTASLAALALRARTARAVRTEEAARSEIARALSESLSPHFVLDLDAGGCLVGPCEAAGSLGLATGERLVERLHVRDRLSYLSTVDRVRAGSDRASCEVRILDAEMAAVRLTVAAGPDGGTLVAVEDRTADLAARHDLDAALAAAQSASAAKSQLLAAVSHELRTPLNAIIGFTDILEQEIFGSFESPRQKEYVGLIQKSGEHLLQVVNGLLDIAKIEAGRYELSPERFDIDAVVSAAAEMLAGEAERKGLRLVLKRTPSEAALFSADRRACQQMLLNLLSNAVKFTAAGTITVSARVEGGQQILVVSDTGVGIDAVDIDRIAHPFVQLGASEACGDQRGTGLGLSLVKGLCELHHGRLDIASRRGVGTTVTVTIPADCAERLGRPDNPNEKIVALNDVRRKSPSSPQTPASRRTA